MIDLNVVTGLSAGQGSEPAVWRLLDRYADKFTKTGKTEGRPRKTLANVVRVLDNDSRWNGGSPKRIRLNVFSGRIEFGEGSRSDADEAEAAVWLDDHYMLAASPKMVSDASSVIARRASYHPVRDYLSALRWDQLPRLSGLLTDYMGAAKTQLHRELSSRWAISAVARIFQPGSKVDTTLILVGPQGARKSSAFRDLAVNPAWFCDSAIDFGSKDAYQNLPGVWIYELAELSSMRPREAETVKAFLSQREDHYRPSYGRNTIDVPRQCVFCGTTNEQEFLRDHTGARRFWPVRIAAIDLPAIVRDRDQLWAEAVERYRAGESWWLGPAAAADLTEAQGEYREVDPWEEAVLEHLAAPNSQRGVTTASVLEMVLKVDPDRQTRGMSMRVAKIFQAVGWEKSRRRTKGGKVRWWTPPS